MRDHDDSGNFDATPNDLSRPIKAACAGLLKEGCNLRSPFFGTLPVPRREIKASLFVPSLLRHLQTRGTMRSFSSRWQPTRSTGSDQTHALRFGF